MSNTPNTDTLDNWKPIFVNGNIPSEFRAWIAERQQAAVQAFANRLLQYNGAYIGIDGKRVDNMVHHDVIKQLSTTKNEEV